ncbi:MAG: NAD(+) synthase, partial [Bacillota bacterium]|nr:NAD(+) synthase [Bacillota bacterium]
MYKHGFLKASLVSPAVVVGNPKENVAAMLAALHHNESSLAVFPELGITGYSCGDLFFSKALLDDAQEGLRVLLTGLQPSPYDGVVVCGLPLEVNEMVLNVAVVLQNAKILGVVPKFYLPNTKEYYEKRWFKSGFDVADHLSEISLLGQRVPFGNLIFEAGKVRFGIEICEDMWATISPGNLLSVNGANVIVNISASNETLGKAAIRRNAVLEHSRKNCGVYVYVSAGASESTSETVFSGHNMVAVNGMMIAESEGMSLDTKTLFADLDLDRLANERRNNSSYRDSILKYTHDYQIVPFALPESGDFRFQEALDRLPFVPKTNEEDSFRKISQIQEFGLAKRMRHLKLSHLVVGISGGLDSALALIVACRAFDRLGLDRKGIVAVTMPAMGTTERTRKNARALMDAVGCDAREICLSEHVGDHLKLIGHDGTTEDVTYENAQARARTMILMDLANKVDGIVLGTGDLSEIALGWSTYNGDQMSMYNVNSGLPKTLVRFTVEQYAERMFDDGVRDTLMDILATPISPELKKNQTTEATIGKYETNDFVLYRFLLCGDPRDRIVFMLATAFGIDAERSGAIVDAFLKRFHSQQFKRQASPDGPKVLDCALSPRADFR